MHIIRHPQRLLLLLGICLVLLLQSARAGKVKLFAFKGPHAGFVKLKVRTPKFLGLKHALGGFGGGIGGSVGIHGDFGAGFGGGHGGGYGGGHSGGYHHDEYHHEEYHHSSGGSFGSSGGFGGGLWGK